jgi:HEAT repeat protein
MSFKLLSRSLIYIVAIVAALIGWVIKHLPQPEVPTAEPLTGLDALRSPDWRIRLRAVEELADDATAIPALVPLLSDKDSDVREAVADVLAVHQFLPQLDTPHVEGREAAIKTLATVGSPEAIERIVHALHHDESAWVRRAAADALGQIGSPELITPLSEALQTETIHTAYEAMAQALTQLGGEQVVRQHPFQGKAAASDEATETLTG